MNFFERLKYLVFGGSVKKTKGMNFVADSYSDVIISNQTSKENGFSFAHASKPKFNFVADSYKSDERFLAEKRRLKAPHSGGSDFYKNDWIVDGLRDDFSHGRDLNHRNGVW